jgi:hypothetical protein
LREQNILLVGVHLSYTDTDMVRQVKAQKNDPKDMAKKVVDAVEHDQTEVLVDKFTEAVKATLSEPVEAMEDLMQRARTARNESERP